MVAKHHTPDAGAASLVPARFALLKLVVFLPVSAVVGVLVAALAEVVQTELHFAPIVLFPLVVGTGLGLLLVVAMRVAQVGHRATVILGTFLAVSTCVIGQHYGLYLAAQNHAAEMERVKAAFPDVAKRLNAAPSDFLSYLSAAAETGRPLWPETTLRGTWAWASWGVDAALTLAAAIGMVVPASRLPYCNGCHGWFRTMRNGRVDGALLARMAELTDIEIEQAPSTGRYRLLSCRGGCGPAGLQLAWQDAGGTTYSADAWLTARQRNAVMELADEANVGGEEQS